MHTSQIKTYSRLAGNTCGNDDNVGACEGLGETIVGLEETLDLGRSVDVGEVGGDTGRVYDIKEGEMGNRRICFEQQRERLANAASSTENNGLESHDRCGP